MKLYLSRPVHSTQTTTVLLGQERLDVMDNQAPWLGPRLPDVVGWFFGPIQLVWLGNAHGVLATKLGASVCAMRSLCIGTQLNNKTNNMSTELDNIGHQ